ncbi:rhamnulokinase family protein [Klugiella xanthotipulae]|uniref:Rhamnulokinase n=1 Tax=Klugiella xanthotipulae TaxID=244735 RepID=A0A543HGX4_9MICO|nr:rhamnulokinase family protein [Klugiella xanthotipulae]TQM57576.1 rhamnulokinase [Klugiella xanthotipulae]
MTDSTVIAVDLGATSGRVISATVSPNRLQLGLTSRFPNNPVTVWAGQAPAMHWNLLELYREVVDGLRVAFREAQRAGGSGLGSIASLGVDSWAVDYGRMRGGALAGIPYHYRDARTAAGVEAVHGAISPAELYAVNGLQFLPFNTVYQLAADRDAGLLDGIDEALLVPDLINYWLTGERRAERTNASTTGLLDIGTGRWSDALLTRLRLPASLLPPLIAPGETVGSLLPSVRDELALGLGAGAASALSTVPVVSVGSHDTASAVVAVPSTDRNIAYISSGTWSLVGLELDSPVLTEASRAANFTNEGGVDGRIRFLRNVMGMWLISECLREWEKAGVSADLPTLLAQAEALPGGSVFDPDHPDLLPAGPMTERIAARCAEAGQRIPSNPAEYVRSIVESLAEAYHSTIQQAASLSGTSVEAIHVVGGGSQNALLCQLTADRTGLPVIAGPVEATAIGNVLVQARAAGVISGDLESLRALVAASVPLTRYTPRRPSHPR